MGFTGLAVTYSPASWDAVPSARRRLTAEFGMGSGVSLALLPPNLESPRAGVRLRGAGGLHETCLSSVGAAGGGRRRHFWVFDFRLEDGSAVFRIG